MVGPLCFRLNRCEKWSKCGQKGLDAAGHEFSCTVNTFEDLQIECHLVHQITMCVLISISLLRGQQQKCFRTFNTAIFLSVQCTHMGGYIPHIRDDKTKHVLFTQQNLPVFSPCFVSLSVSAAALPVLMSLFRFIKGLSELLCCPWNRWDRCFPISGKVGCFHFHN